MRPLVLLITIVLFQSCIESEKKLTAQQIIDKAIAAHCNGNCDRAKIEFTFRDKQYINTVYGGAYEYERRFMDSLGVVKDVLNNTGFSRTINGSSVVLADTTAVKLSESVNSVHYFVKLPYGLNAPAVQKELLGETAIKQKDYYVIKITFSEEGGGADFEDIFVYWFAKNDFSMDYLAYKYAVNGGGVRFREAFNKRDVNGITFLDFNNYKPEKSDVDLTTLPTLYEEAQLTLVSKIKTEAIKVTIIE